ncbi:chemotaxis protein [Bacterioplanes sanyensis]|uniref:Chemotaxis protein n=1 Tax=Bacterioplanes sanyensis TaxID=1249553 RepID=A0A222FLZ4_9GAMM|nr:methyl-accepting chemotaxis protein [Bacterioplanes sanyensis]ASP39779.1 chemotaxis protein [Bacterioplanes sanyensis]
MQFLGAVSIKVKILSLAAVAIVGFITNLLINSSVNQENSERLQTIQERYFPVVQESKANLVRLARIEELLSTAVSTGEMDFVRSADALQKEVLNSFDSLDSLWPGAANDSRSARQAFSEYFRVARNVSAGMAEGTIDMSSLSGSIKTMNAALELSRGQMQQYSAAAIAAFDETVTQSNNAVKDALLYGMIVTLVAVVILLLVAWSTTRSIGKSLSGLLGSLKDIAQGEGHLTRRIDKTSSDEIGDVVDWFNLFVEKLHSSIGEIVAACQPLTKVSADLGDLTSQTSQASERQNMATEQVSLVVEEMATSIREVSSSANSAAEAAHDADSSAKAGGEVVNQTVTSINRLAQEVERAGDVIRQLEADTGNVAAILDVIKGIAEQTNLLALNAAIEAARAGEQGRGFAVVADEVRTLASRTQDSTQEIQNVIEKLQSAANSAVSAMADSKARAEESVTQAAKTNDSLSVITEKIESISAMNMSIASTTEQQDQAAASILENVSGIRATSEAALASVQQVENASQSLASISATLQRVTGQFRV